MGTAAASVEIRRRCIRVCVRKRLPSPFGFEPAWKRQVARPSPCFPRSAQPPAVHLQVGRIALFTSPACLSDTRRRRKAIHRIAAATTWHTTWWGCAPSMAPKRTVFKRPAAFKRQAATEAEPSSTPRHTNKGVCQVHGCMCRTQICAYAGCRLLCKENPPPQAWAPES